MKCFALMLSLSMFLCLTGVAADLATDQQGNGPPAKSDNGRLKRVLVFSGTGWYRHPEIPATNGWLVRLGLEHGVDVDVSETPADITPQRLAQYQVLLLNNANELNKVLDEKQRDAVQKWYQHGGGIVGLHAALVHQQGWPWLHDLAGCDFNSDSVFARARVIVDPKTKDDPLVKGQESEFWYQADWHNHDRSVTGLPGVRVILRLDESTFEPVRDYFKPLGGKPMGADHPMTWTREHDGGRFFYTELGHDVRSLDTPFGKKLVIEAMRWTANASPLGTQEFRDLAPSDLLEGRILFAGQMISRDGESFVFVPESHWGEYHFQFTPTGQKPNELAAKSINEKLPQIDSTTIAFADVSRLGEKQKLVLDGTIWELREQGTSFLADVSFAGQTISYQVKLIKETLPTSKASPTKRHMRYGPHWRQMIDFYAAPSDKPTPLVCFIHGGGWVAGDKSGIGAGFIKELNQAGISVAAIDYRLTPEATDQGVEPPVRWPLSDCARAVQYLRHHAADLNLDKTKVGATGGSAGACSSLWLAFHDDMADAKSSDPIATESTRLKCAAVIGAQTTLDPVQMKEWIPNSRYGGHAFGFRKPGQGRDSVFEEFLADRERVLPWIREYSPIEHLTADDPPVMLTYDSQKDPVVKGTPQADPTHSALFGLILEEKAKSVGTECIITWPDHKSAKYATPTEFLIDHLKN